MIFLPDIITMNGIYFWNMVNSLIKEQNTTQEAIAHTCGINFGTFKNRSSKKTIPTATDVYKIAQALNTTVEFLLTGNSTNPAEIELQELKDKIKNLYLNL